MSEELQEFLIMMTELKECVNSGGPPVGALRKYLPVCVPGVASLPL